MPRPGGARAAAERLFPVAGCGAARRFAAGGAQLEQGADILLAEGPAAAPHLAARTARALLELGSGIAARARRIPLAARQGRPRIAVACGGGPLPGAGDVALKAVMAAGCPPHRFGLSDGNLVLARHRAFLGRQPPREWVARLRAAPPERRIAVEAGSVDEAVLLARSGADRIHLARLAPEQVADAVRAISASDRRPALAAAGGIDEGNAAVYAAAGADVLVTAAPYAAPPIEVTLAMAEG
ncbi:ModD protein [Dankookia rubra]|uniref:ModD protein n=1 Tax=Dankookia rubra TaxID=1442381 RepID=A0A4R5QAK0_9PROT|nr:ModD protein [Dankookia rubra]TDH59391.1 ModD protein [Dankookia rubra]